MTLEAHYMPNQMEHGLLPARAGRGRLAAEARAGRAWTEGDPGRSRQQPPGRGGLSAPSGGRPGRPSVGWPPSPSTAVTGCARRSRSWRRAASAGRRSWPTRLRSPVNSRPLGSGAGRARRRPTAALRPSVRSCIRRPPHGRCRSSRPGGEGSLPARSWGLEPGGAPPGRGWSGPACRRGHRPSPFRRRPLTPGRRRRVAPGAVALPQGRAAIPERPAPPGWRRRTRRRPARTGMAARTGGRTWTTAASTF